MRRILLLLILLYVFGTSVSATEFTAPSAPVQAEGLMPSQQNSFGEDLWYIVKQALPEVLPTVYSALRICVSIISICIMASMLKNMSSHSVRTIELASAISIGTLLLSSSKSFITLAIQTIEAISEYGKLLFPVMTAALAAEGGTTSSASLYTGTVIFNTLLMSAITKVIVPILYGYLALSIVLSIYSASMLKTFKNFFKWSMTWCLKICIYLFTGYLAITKVISGTTDAIALKATKLTISGMIPVVGGMISDASETILLSIGTMKNVAGIYGMLTIVSICIVPFMMIGVQCLLLKLTEGICGLFSVNAAVDIIHDFSYCLEFLLAVTGTVCILLMVSTVCFMKGVA